MGDPRRMRKKYESPKKPWERTLLETELRLLGEYGLKNKRELRCLEATLRSMRKVARSIFALPEEERIKKTAELSAKLKRMGLIGEGATIDQVLELSPKNLLERRLQTVVYRRGLANSIYQARQFITHGHVMVDERVIKKPGKLLRAHEENLVKINPKSSLADPGHPLWSSR